MGKDEIKVIGLTGGTGTGKSTAAKIMKEFGGIIIDADKISRKLMEPGEVSYNEVVGHFGKEILTEEGIINRKILGGIVFRDKDKLKLLNKLTHSHVSEYINKKISRIKSEAAKEPLKEGEIKFIVLDVPIPVEEGFFDVSNTIWSLTANDDIRIERIMSRSGISEEEAVQRINFQMSNREYMEIADVIIENERDIDALKRRIAEELVHYFNIDIYGGNN